MFPIKIISYFFFGGFFIQTQCVSVYVNTKLGTIKGTTMLSRNGNKFYAFLGVPYAKPPIGELRFRNPEPVKPWNGILDATIYGTKCIQPWLESIVGDEDCLHLNIYTPMIQQNETNRLFPIWVFIYGGRKLYGEPAPYKYGPEYIMDKPVILITISYRMGPLGFLSTEDEPISGNFGLKDEVAGLQWIRENMESFSGDPSNVTLSGGSSGAIDVHFHLYSPLSKGLFHRAISQSGQALNSDAVHQPGKARKLAWQLGNIVGCNISNLKTSEDLVTCLRKVPAEELARGSLELKHDYILPFMLFGPVLENKNIEGAFLVEDPCISIHKSSTIPWMIGGIRDEGSQQTLRLFLNNVILEHFERNYQKLFPEYFRYDSFKNTSGVTEIIKQKYIGYKKLNESFYELSNIYGFGNSHLGTIETVSRYKGPIYLYLYDHENKFAYVKTYLELLATKRNRKLGAVHGEELISIFNIPLLYPPILEGDDRIVSEQVVTLWHNFVACGNPNGENGKPIWKASSPGNLEYLHIRNLKLTMKSNYFIGDEYNFWKRMKSPTLCPALSLSMT